MKNKKKVNDEDESLKQALKTWECKSSGGLMDKTKQFVFDDVDELLEFEKRIFSFQHEHNVLIETINKISEKCCCLEVEVNSYAHADDNCLIEKIEREYIKVHGQKK